MKLAALILVALLGTANASLNDDVQDILDLIPTEEIREITLWYAENDEQFQWVLAYLRSDSFHAIVNAIRSEPAYDEFVEFLAYQGINIYEFIAKIQEILGLDSVRNVNLPRSYRTAPRSFHGWMDEVLALIPFAEIRELAIEKSQTSGDFQDLIAAISSSEFQTIVEAVVAVPEYQDLLTAGRDHGVPIDTWLDAIYAFFGWTRA
ncbi:uncharacterized protein LOC124416829 [Diprion similis]|uniref:uncharacterized protein LOC124416829 n=1 Tax=Diprion similis TaxID=362088 RepID=UPI001EF8D568|nr:uncharacterized protein LOC124416829 [Diprion similis]